MKRNRPTIVWPKRTYSYAEVDHALMQRPKGYKFTDDDTQEVWY